jgi:altronate dehydratase
MTKDELITHHLKQDARQRMKQFRRKHGEIVGKDWLWIIPALALVAYLIAHLVISL